MEVDWSAGVSFELNEADVLVFERLSTISSGANPAVVAMVNLCCTFEVVSRTVGQSSWAMMVDELMGEQGSPIFKERSSEAQCRRDRTQQDCCQTFCWARIKPYGAQDADCAVVGSPRPLAGVYEGLRQP